MPQTLDAIVHAPQTQHKKTIIWLHGLGADGSDFATLAPQLNIPDELGIKWVFPHAPIRPITINRGLAMRGWYDIVNMDHDNFIHDKTGITDSVNQLNDLIDQELQSGLTPQDILLIGFSQGGAIALTTAVHSDRSFAGCLGLSTYLPVYDDFSEHLTPESRHTPIGLFHGTQDEIIPLRSAELTHQFLQTNHYQVSYKTYPMGHSIHPKELIEIRQFIVTALRHKWRSFQLHRP